ncbi:MAG: cysteine desulfhydrase [Marinomonas atlantica]|nr:cysteine desulfhydrase [Marinomonas atlantica]
MQFDTLLMPGPPDDSGNEFLIYRGDLECNIAPGNKQHKLKYHMQQALSEGCQYVATFGGPHSNHVAALVASCQLHGLKPLIVVRGETWAKLTPTLQSAVASGAVLFPSTRQDYRLGLASEIKQTIDSYYSNVYWVPEGGAGPLGVMGCFDWAKTISQHSKAEGAHFCVASGTGATAAGFASSGIDSLSVFSALKGTHNLTEDVQSLCRQAGLDITAQLSTYDECLHGGFGRISKELVNFLRTLYRLNPSIILDPIYTSKMVYQVYQLQKKGLWPHRRTLFVHTGGLQGWLGVKKDQQPYSDPERYSC